VPERAFGHSLVTERDDAIEAAVPYAAAMTVRPRFHANDHSRDVLSIAPRVVWVANARKPAPAPSLEREGFQLVRHASAIADFRDQGAIGDRHAREIEALLLELSGADAVAVGPRGVLRFAERSPECGRYDNSHPARFVHVDVSDATAALFAAQSNPFPDRPMRRFCHYNVWRVLSPPPQDVPLAVCDARTVGLEDLVAADAIFDARDGPEWSFEALVVRGSSRHRWSFFRDMDRDEVLVFKTNDSDPLRPHCVPHVAVDDARCPPGTPPRMSIEMRGTAYWYS
jgi:hypothetical protein